MTANVSRNPQDGTRRVPSGPLSPANGATKPKPSVALWSANPTTSTPTKAICPAAAGCPIARPFVKLCTPIPAAIKNANVRAGKTTGLCPVDCPAGSEAGAEAGTEEAGAAPPPPEPVPAAPAATRPAGTTEVAATADTAARSPEAATTCRRIHRS